MVEASHALKEVEIWIAHHQEEGKHAFWSRVHEAFDALDHDGVRY